MLQTRTRRDDKETVRRASGDLYALLGVSSGVSNEQLRKAYNWILEVERSAGRREQARRAYAVLGDPRLRADYDRGRTVGVGLNRLYQRGEAPGRRPPSGLPATASRQVPAAHALQNRWERRWNGQAQPRAAPTGSLLDRRVSPAWVLGGLAILGTVLTAAVHAPGLWPTPTASPLSASAPIPAAVPAPHRASAPPSAAPAYRTGNCLSGDAEHVQLGRPIACGQPHYWQVTSMINLSRLLGHQPMARDLTAATRDCSSAFTRYTGLPEGADGLGSASVVATFTGTAWNTCLVASGFPRTDSAAHLAQ